VATVKVFLDERPSALTSACALAPSYGIEAHAIVVGIPAVAGTCVATVQADIQVQRHDSVQGQRTQALKSWLLTDRGINGSVAKATGMSKASVKGVEVSGVPPQGRPV
jgi:hypothetical protein